MRKTLAAGLAAITFLGAGLAMAQPAQAQSYRYGDPYHHRRDNDNDVAGAAIVAGVIGLALGAAIASNDGDDDRRYYDRRYYDRRYDDRRRYDRRHYDRRYYDRYGYSPYGYSAYGRSYGYQPRHRTCESRRWVYDRYSGRRIPVRTRYAC